MLDFFLLINLIQLFYLNPTTSVFIGYPFISFLSNEQLIGNSILLTRNLVARNMCVITVKIK